MLSLTRHVGEKIIIGNDITLVITEITPKYIKIGIDADDDVLILRSEVANRDDESEGNK